MSDGTHQLPETSRNALIRMADMLRDGFTGRFEVDCSQGAVAQVREVHVVGTGELKDGDEGS